MSGIVQQPRLLTVEQVARRLRLSEVTVRRRIRQGDIPAVQLGGRHAPIRVDERELEEWLYDSRTEAGDR